MAMTPKQLAQYKKTQEEILALEKEIKKQVEEAGKLKGEEYKKAVEQIKAEGKVLEKKKARIKAQDEINKKTRRLNQEKDKELLLEMNLKESQKEINDLSKFLLNNRTKLTKKEQERLTTEIARRQVNQDVAKLAQTQADLEEKLQLASFKYGENLKMAKEQAIMMVKALMKNPLLIIAAIALSIGELMAKAAEQAASFRDTVGTSVNQSIKLTKSLAMAAVEGKALGYNVSEISNNIVDSFGNLDAVSSKSVKTIGRFEKVLGVTPEHSAGLMMQMQKVAGLSEEASISMMTNLAATAETNNIPIGKLFEDMSSSSEEIAAYGGENLENIKRAAVEARRMGVNLATSLKIADSLLDFETSIASEMEASLMIGKQLNFNRARQLALEGDVAGAARDVVKQIGGQAEFAKLNVLQRKKLAESIGVSVDELSKLSSGKVEFKEPKKTVEEKMLSATELAKAASLNNTNALKILTAAVVGLTAVMAFKSLSKVFGGKGGPMASAKRFFKKTKSGKFDKRGGLGKIIKSGKGKVTAATTAGKGLLSKGAGLVGKGVGLVGKAGKGVMSAAKGAGGALKGLGKGAGKSLLKKIPGVGLIAGLGFAASRLMKGDGLGALGELASGAASLIPGVGTAASMAIDAGLVAKDMKASKNKGKSAVFTDENRKALNTGYDFQAAQKETDPKALKQKADDSNALANMVHNNFAEYQRRAHQDGIITEYEQKKIQELSTHSSLLFEQSALLDKKLDQLIAATQNVGKDVANKAMDS